MRNSLDLYYDSFSPDVTVKRIKEHSLNRSFDFAAECASKSDGKTYNIPDREQRHILNFPCIYSKQLIF